MSEGIVRVGVGGWTFPPWRGVFYPQGLPQSKELEFASRTLTAIEINATFYGRQKPSSWENWEKVAPDGFQYRNAGMEYVRIRLGKIVEHRVHLDTQKVAELDEHLAEPAAA